MINYNYCFEHEASPNVVISNLGEGFLLNGDLQSQEPALSDSTSQDVLSVASSHGSGSTPPREFVVSAFEPNNCGAEFTVSSQSSYDELRGKVSDRSVDRCKIVFLQLSLTVTHLSNFVSRSN